MAMAYLADLWSKEAVLASMHEGERITVIDPLLTWHFIRNPGAAFSIGVEYTWIFSIVQAVGLLIVVYLILFRARTLPWLITLRSEEHTSELQSRGHLVCRLLL